MEKHSMAMLQLNPQIPVETPKGKGYAFLVIDYSQDHDLFFVVFIDESRECWTFKNSEIRAVENITLGRLPPDFKVNKSGSWEEEKRLIEEDLRKGKL